ncbi:MAG TPA: Ldh family oxidoreductase, partial [Chryseolinea sp.]|nr:Ldh family oxidoreductase [Chryseolinea sp.]
SHKNSNNPELNLEYIPPQILFMSQPKYFTFSSSYLSDFTTQVFVYFGVSETDAVQAAAVLSKADLRGIDSHGVARLRTYVDMFKIGRINPKPNIKIIREKKSVATVDGDSGLGLVVGPKANEIAMDKAAQHGSGWVSVCNTNHYGIASYYSLKALERDMIGWSMTNSSKIVVPLWGAERRLGTNPIAIAFPGLKNPPIVIDMATSVVAFGKVEIAERQDKKIPEGWIIDGYGNTSTSPKDIYAGGLLPLGGTRQMGGHKGYCLSSMVDILCCVLSGANWGPFAPPFAIFEEAPKESVGKGIGHFFGAMEIDGFEDVEVFKKRIDHWIEVFRNTKPTPGHDAVLIPGDPEHEAETIRSKEGIPVIQAVVDELIKISKETGIEFKI